MSIPDIRRCSFSTYGCSCGAETVGTEFCERHDEMTCSSCGAKATHGCDFCGQFVCGAPLCDDCIGTSDKGPAGAWGFMNHVHIRRGAKLPSQIREEEKIEADTLLAQSLALGVGRDE